MKVERVYFLRPIGADGPVKVGYSGWPNDRLAAYSKWSPLPLEIAATIEGGCALEHRFHALFKHLHSHHEWFFAAPEITAVIDAINAGTFDPATLPKGATLFEGGLIAETLHSEWLSTVGRFRWLVRRGQVPTDVRAATQYDFDAPPAEKARKRDLIRAFMASMAEPA